MQEFIKLQGAHVNQHTKDGKKGEWQVEENETNKNMWSLPGHFNHNEIFSILDFARKYELIAFNEGIAFGKAEARKSQKGVIERYEERIKEMTKENERLAAAFEILTNN